MKEHGNGRKGWSYRKWEEEEEEELRENISRSVLSIVN
jgi:hypothetical protein